MSVCARVCISFSVILRYKVEYQECLVKLVLASSQTVSLQLLQLTSASDCSGNQTSHPDCEI